MLGQRGIFNSVYFNPLPYIQKTRGSSGRHKAKTINEFNNRQQLTKIALHFEDDDVQANIITQLCPDVTVVLLQHNLVNKENQRHVNF